MKKFLILICLSILTTFLFSQADIDGFRGYKWGTPYTDMSKDLEPSKSKNPGFKGYEIKGDDLTYMSIDAHSIIYLFKKNQFFGVIIGYYNKDYDKALKAATAKFGDGKFTDTPFFKNTEWHLAASDITVTYFTTNKSDQSITLNISKKRTK